MKSITRYSAPTLVLGLFACTFAVLAAPTNILAQEADDDGWLEEVTLPGPEHDFLDSLAGEFSTTIKIWWNGPDQKPEEMKGKSTKTWRLQGRFLEEMGENPTSNGDTFQTVGYWGYNRATGQYENYWINNQSTGMYMEVGRYDPNANVIRTRGEYADVGTGYVAQNRTDIAVAGPDQHTLTGYTTFSDGVESKFIEIVYDRVK